MDLATLEAAGKNREGRRHGTLGSELSSKLPPRAEFRMARQTTTR